MSSARIACHTWCDLIHSRRTKPLFDLVGCEPPAVLESRCNAVSGERQAISTKAFPFAAAPSGALARYRPSRARMGSIAIGLASERSFPDVLCPFFECANTPRER